MSTQTPTRPQPPRVRSPWTRGLLAVSLAVAALPVAVFCAWGASVSATGCFIGCDPTQVSLPAALAFVLAVAALLSVGPAVAALTGRDRRWATAAGWTFGTVAVVGALMVLGA